MFAKPDNTNRSEPLLARHARWVHQKARTSFRLAYLKDMNQMHAVQILEPAHERRARTAEAEASGDYLTQLAVEDMRINIHRTYLPRSTLALIAAAIVSVAITILTIGQIYSNLDAAERIYLVARGMPDASVRSVVDRTLSTDVNTEQKGIRAWFRSQFHKADPHQKTHTEN